MKWRSKHPSPPHREDRSRSGWDRYLDPLIRNRVPEATRRWSVTRAKQLIDGMRSVYPLDLTVDDSTEHFFQKISGESRLNPWQCRQSVEAVQLLVVDLAQVKTGNLAARNPRNRR